MDSKKAKPSAIAMRGMLGGAVAAVINILVFIIARSTEISFTLPGRKVGDPSIELNTLGILISTLIPAVGAILLMLLLNKLSKNPFRIFLIIAVVFLLVSFFPLSINVATSTKILLGFMHLIAAAGIIFGLKTAYKA